MALVMVAVALPDVTPRHHIRMRNFYGTLQVNEVGTTEGAYRALFNWIHPAIYIPTMLMGAA